MISRGGTQQIMRPGFSSTTIYIFCVFNSNTENKNINGGFC
jgi:hypothetical protein